MRPPSRSGNENGTAGYTNSCPIIYKLIYKFGMTGNFAFIKHKKIQENEHN